MSIADRGFASMDKKKQKEISKKGGIASGKSRALRAKGRRTTNGS